MVSIRAPRIGRPPDGRRAMVVLLLLAGACSSPAPSAAHRPAPGTEALSSADVSAPTAPDVVRVTTTMLAAGLPAARTPVTVPGSCPIDRLEISAGQQDIALGHVGLPLMFRNRGSAVCTMTGYPDIVGLDFDGAKVVQATRSPRGYLGGLASVVASPPVISLASGQSASALVEADDIPAGDARSCPTYAALLVAPPASTNPVRVGQGLPGCNGLDVHPVVPGSTGSQP